MSVLKSKEFWIGAAAAVVLIKFGPMLPFVGTYVSRATGAVGVSGS